MTKLNSIGIAKDPKDTLVVVAMSGGVDSSTVAAMMKNEGYKVIGITLKLYNDNKETASSKQCCAGQDIMDAKRVADKLKIEHKILYYQNKFKEGVIDNFIDSYLNGETPIPCVQCNKTVKFTDLFKEAKRLKGDTSENIIALLESRLDSIIYRANFVPTMFAARQFINHKHIEVNGRVVNISSYQIKIGDVISIKNASKELLIVLETIQKKERDIPDYIEVDYKQKSVKLLSLPSLSDVPYPSIMQPNLVVEYYSA